MRAELKTTENFKLQGLVIKIFRGQAWDKVSMVLTGNVVLLPRKKITIRFVVFLYISWAVPARGAPPAKREQFGPCVGMDCMHGVLMHGDTEHGRDHVAEDRFRSEIENEAAKSGSDKTGPCQGMDCLHGVLMHGDKKEGVQHMHQKAGPQEKAKQAGPGEGMEFLHGVLMHGDGRPGREHHHEEDHAKRKGTTTDGGDDNQKGPCVGMDCLHGVLMHGDMEAGRNHEQEHAHDKQKLMEKLGKIKQPGSPNLESAMHGAGQNNHVHSEHNKPPTPDKHKGVPSVSDPHEAIHGHLQTQIKLGESTDKDAEDYLEWLKQNREKSEEKNTKEGSAFLGFTFPFISDSLLDDIEILKRRYLPKFWGGEGEELRHTEGVGDKMGNAENEQVHDIIDDLKVIGDTAPLTSNHRHHPHQESPEGSGVTHDEG